MIASLSLESLNSLTTPLRSSQGLVWLGAVQENTHRAGNAIYAPQSQAGSRIARRVMSRVTAGARAVTPPVMLPGPGSWDLTQKTAGDVFTSLWGNWQPSIDPDICFHTLCFVSYNILLFLRYRGWHWVRFRWDHVAPAPTLCPPTQSRDWASRNDRISLWYSPSLTWGPVMVRTRVWPR